MYNINICVCVCASPGAPAGTAAAHSQTQCFLPVAGDLSDGFPLG